MGASADILRSFPSCVKESKSLRNWRKFDWGGMVDQGNGPPLLCPRACSPCLNLMQFDGLWSSNAGQRHFGTPLFVITSIKRWPALQVTACQLLSLYRSMEGIGPYVP
jgi:hypothetical protein